MIHDRWRHFAVHIAKTTMGEFRQISQHRTTEQVIAWMKDHFERVNGHSKDLRIYVDGVEYGSVLYKDMERLYDESQKLKT